MPVNPFPILIPLLLLWMVITYRVFRWRRSAGGLFILLWVGAVVVVIVNSGVERTYSERMNYRLIDVDGQRVVKLYGSKGDTLTVTSPEVFDRLQNCREASVDVSLTAWYAFGRPYAYQVRSVDGVAP